jgi:hypothetical protein
MGGESFCFDGDKPRPATHLGLRSCTPQEISLASDYPS